MKKLITICLVITVFTVKAQTKEETISWLTEKLTKYCYSTNANVFVESISECQIILKETASNGNDFSMVSYIPTKGMKINVDVNNHDMYFPIEAIEKKISYTNSDASRRYFSKSTSFKITEGEDQLLSRIEKAVAHLATFCPEKKKETF